MIDVFVSGDTFIDISYNGKTIWIDATHSQPNLHFDTAANLTVDGTESFRVKVKKLDLTSNAPVFTSGDGTVDGYYIERKLIEPMDCIEWAAIMNPITGLGGIYALSRAHDHSEMRAMRTVATQNYNVSPHDFEVEHRGAPNSAGGTVNWYLPPLKQIIGTVPPIGHTPNPNDPTQQAGYLPKTFHFTKIESSPHACLAWAYNGGHGLQETINGQLYLRIDTLYERLVCQAKGDGWTAQRLAAA